MARNQPPSGQVLRLFVACYPTQEIAEQLARHAGACPDSGRTVPAEQLHLTLLFLGEVRARELRETTVSVERSAAGIATFELTTQRLLTLPADRSLPPRLLAMQTDAPAALHELRKRLVHRLASPAQRNRDRFLPHFTLKRFDHAATVNRIDEPVETLKVPISEIRLVRSVLKPTGAAHDTLERFPLTQ